MLRKKTGFHPLPCPRALAPSGGLRWARGGLLTRCPGALTLGRARHPNHWPSPPWERPRCPSRARSRRTADATSSAEGWPSPRSGRSRPGPWLGPGRRARPGGRGGRLPRTLRRRLPAALHGRRARRRGRRRPTSRRPTPPTRSPGARRSTSSSGPPGSSRPQAAPRPPSQKLADLTVRQLEKARLRAAEAPGTIPEVVKARTEAEARQSATQDGFVYTLERPGKPAEHPSANDLDRALLGSRDLADRQAVWEASKTIGGPLRDGPAPGPRPPQPGRPGPRASTRSSRSRSPTTG